MLDGQTIATVKATIPVLAQAGPALTAHFYDRMFLHNPELKDIFNLSHQFSGAQREALFDAICAYAANIENLPALLPAVERIAQKHASFGIRPEQYAIVGHHLLATIDEMLSPGQDVLDAWGKAYQVLADVFINRESEIYQDRTETQGGWQGTRPFRIEEKRRESDVITSFTLVPTDGRPVSDFRPGQYVAVYIRSDDMENQEIRQYSLTHAPNGRSYRIAVKREDEGKVSRYLHDVAQQGDVIHLAPPYGDFWLDVPPNAPVALLSGGVGQTPMLAMLNTLKQRQHKGKVYWLHAADSEERHAFRQEAADACRTLPDAVCHVWYRNSIAGSIAHHEGLLSLEAINEAFPPETEFYFCGPLAFMQSAARQLTDRGVAKERLHYEVFGPHKVL